MDPLKQCPACHREAALIDRITLLALLTPDALRRGAPSQPRYCATHDCPVVYFGDEGSTFAESDLTVRVYARHMDDPEALVCYCFGVTAGSLCDAERAAEIRMMVTREVQAGHCACEVRNPKGSCCLGDLARIERGEQNHGETSCESCV